LVKPSIDRLAAGGEAPIAATAAATATV